MWTCFPSCPLSRRSKEKENARAVVPSTPRPFNSEECGGFFVLTQFSRDVERRWVEFVPPVPPLSRCSLCGMVPPRLYTSESCHHELCSCCLDSAQPVCPFDGTAWRPAATNTEPLDLVSRASVFCWNRRRGCSYVGCLLDMPSHYHKCPYYVTRCGMCGQQVRVKELTAHAKRLCNTTGGPEAGKQRVVQKIQGAVFPPDPPRSPNLASPTRSRKADFIWTIGPYSKIRRGVHFFRSEPFLTKAGHMLQLLGSIDGVNTVQLRTAVSDMTRTPGKAPEWRHPRTAGTFILLKNDELGRISETTLSAKTAHVSLKTNVPVNAWKSVARLDKARFEKDFVSNDAFVLQFAE